MSRRQITHPVGFIVTDEHIDSPSSLLHHVLPLNLAFSTSDFVFILRGSPFQIDREILNYGFGPGW
jgi:hypothetical protein